MSLLECLYMSPSSPSLAAVPGEWLAEQSFELHTTGRCMRIATGGVRSQVPIEALGKHLAWTPSDLLNVRHADGQHVTAQSEIFMRPIA